MPYCPECSASVPEGAARCPTCGSTLVTTPSATDPGAEAQPLDVEQLRVELAASLAPRYEMLKLLGSGGMGAVFLAREPALRRLVAVKVLSPYLAAEPRARSRFEREARAAAALSHPNVVRVYAVGETATTHLPYIVMQYVEGATLGQWMAGRKRVPERDARRIIGEVAAALAAAHTRELVHRDVKPSNVLIENESGRAFVADFGVSAALSPVDQTTKLTMTGTIIGTPAYMSPEQAAGEAVTPKSDVYSLGLLTYELLTGALPYAATSAMGWAAAHLRDPATPVGIKRPDLSPDVARLVDRCLAKQPEDRPDAEDISRAMMPSLEGEIPWPPPGLDWLKGRGRVLARVSLLIVAGGLMTMAALAYTPRILQVHAYWLARFTPVFPSADGRVAVRDLGATSQFVWQSVLIVGLTAFVASVVGLGIAGAQTARFVWLRQKRGWRWETLLDVAVDHDGRSGWLLAGAREFASLDAAVRHRVLRARRLRTMGELSAGLWVTIVALTWAAAMVAGLVSNTTNASPFGVAFYWAAMIPAVALLVLGALAENQERRLTAVVTRRPAFVESEADVAAWYAAAPDAQAPTPSRPGPHRGLMLAGELALAALTLAVLFALAAAVGSALVGAIVTTRLGPGTVQLTAASDVINREDPIGTARRLVAAYLPASRPGDDSATTALLAQLLRGAGPGAHALPQYDPSPAAVYATWRFARPDRASPGPRRPPRRLAARGFEALRRATAGRIPADTLRLLDRLGRHPRTTVFRELTRVDHWDVTERSAVDWALASPWLGAVTEAALANFLAAIGDVARGDVAQARSRLGENATAGLRLLESPVEGGSQSGRMMLEDALSEFADLEQLQGDAPRAADFRDAAQRLSLLQLLTTFDLPGLAGDPADLASLTDVLRDSRLPAEWRIRLMSRVLDGACANPREILLGASANRSAFVRTAGALMSDIPHAREFAMAAADPPSKHYFEGGGLKGFAFRMSTCLFGS